MPAVADVNIWFLGTSAQSQIKNGNDVFLEEQHEGQNEEEITKNHSNLRQKNAINLADLDAKYRGEKVDRRRIFGASEESRQFSISASKFDRTKLLLKRKRNLKDAAGEDSGDGDISSDNANDNSYEYEYDKNGKIPQPTRKKSRKSNGKESGSFFPEFLRFLSFAFA